MATQSPSLDHLILLVPPSPSPPTVRLHPYYAKHFTLAPGGVHADNLTANSLILLQDGCYIELITFITSSPSTIASHWWGGQPPTQRKPGWVDWCLTTIDGSPDAAQQNFERVNEGAGEGHKYAEPVYGGRLRPDGKEVKWAVTFPEGENGGQAVRGLMPFFCHDIGDREIRVPVRNENLVKHPCGAVGVLEVQVIVRDTKSLGDFLGVYERVLGTKGTKDGKDKVVFTVGRVREVKGLNGGSRVVFRVANGSEKERVGARGYCVSEITLAVLSGEKEKGLRQRLDPEGDDNVGGLWIENVGGLEEL